VPQSRSASHACARCNSACMWHMYACRRATQRSAPAELALQQLREPRACMQGRAAAARGSGCRHPWARPRERGRNRARPLGPHAGVPGCGRRAAARSASPRGRRVCLAGECCSGVHTRCTRNQCSRGCRPTRSTDSRVRRRSRGFSLRGAPQVTLAHRSRFCQVLIPHDRRQNAVRPGSRRRCGRSGAALLLSDGVTDLAL
jgi:hypothetical protein